MKTFTAGFAAKLAVPRGSAPVWFLTVTVAGITRYLSDQVINISGWNGGITTLAWVSQWGQIEELVTGGLNEIHISDFTVTLIVDPDTTTDITNLATTHNLEASACSLYLWFIGLNSVSDPPIEFFRGYVKDISLPDEFTVNLTLEDENSRLTGVISGQAATRAEFPAIYTDHDGRMVPILFGAASVHPPCIVVDNVNNLWTYLVSRKPLTGGYSFIGRDTGNTLNVAQTAAGGVASASSTYGGYAASYANNGIKWGAPGQYWNDNTATIFPDTWTVTLNALYNINEIHVFSVQDGYGTANPSAGMTFTQYGITAFNLEYYNGYAWLPVPGGIITGNNLVWRKIAFSPVSASAVRVIVNGAIDGWSRLAEVEVYASLLDDITTSAEKYTGQPGSQLAPYGSMAVVRVPSKYLISSGSPVTVTKRPISTSGEAGSWSNLTNAYDGNTSTYAYVSSAATATFQFGSMGVSGNLSFTLTILSLTNAWPSILYTFYKSDGTQLYQDWVIPSGWPSPVLRTNTFTMNNISFDLNGCFVTATVFYQDNYPVPSIYDINLSITYRTAPVYGTANIDLAVTATGDNTITAAAQSLLAYGGITASVVVSGGVPTGPVVSGALVEADTVRNYLDYLAWQFRCFYRISLGVPRLIYRPDTLTAATIISAVRVDAGKKVWSRSRVTVDSILNIINLRYGRKYQSSGNNAYTGLIAVSDATSRATYGDHEKPELFQFDLVTDATVATAVANYYIATYKDRKWLHEFETFLDHVGLEFGDIVQLNFAAGVVGVVVSVGIQPGNVDEMDRVRLTVMV